ncbi:SDR family oxidoreductase [Actinomycetospora termitidis]|uniref:SDR family oxidoreductase n=1 Tax=Actinomycetospora termitidis TaxID=3053470 RepID=A0ABT7MBC6_9PSEU|nr:SDR family oxidoreductase [Actinomycetospora sp. Odt1-22]MDL5157965.1 SDR family oxidoreductase [Actinomycetospora sp. Odt1-22]
MGRVLVTGASRRRGIGAAIVRRLHDDGHRVVAHGWRPYDETEPWGADDEPFTDRPGVTVVTADLADPGAPARLVADAGPLDALVVNHARSQLGRLGELDADTLDRTWAVNVRATLLLVQAFAAQAPDGGRVVLFTSGQHRGPMPTEIPYATTKGALAAITATLADALADRGITVNTVNPGPTDTGWADEATTAAVGKQLPRGRWNRPEEAADVVALLLDGRAATITGQVVDAEGGFRRWTA